ncbi:MAG: nucleotide-binding protein, partial [Bacteroidaceae bacterium]|nr:nucleotide-binding protein [Bacteroidaceae bacterium]
TTMTNKIFIVHGHDNEMKLAVARLLEKIGFEPKILSEQADQGRTIIEKFEEESDVGFAVVLFSDKDDMGAEVGSLEYKPRARQNVILELGYFIGKLGRKHVCVLKKGDVEVPSDILGVVYKTYKSDDDGWKYSLCKELNLAGYNVDFNKI